MKASSRSPTGVAGALNEREAAVVIGRAYSIIIPVASRPQIDVSFARYVAARKGEASARSREGAAYAYSGDIKVRTALDRVRPVTLAVEAAVRLWQSVEKARMLGTSVKVTGKPAYNESVNVVAGETMGLLIGPGGVVPMQVY